MSDHLTFEEALVDYPHLLVEVARLRGVEHEAKECIRSNDATLGKSNHFFDGLRGAIETAPECGATYARGRQWPCDRVPYHEGWHESYTDNGRAKWSGRNYGDLPGPWERR